MKQHLWIALYFNNLAIEVIPGSLNEPRAVLTGQKHQDRVLMCNPVASRLGVRPGLSINAALALVPELEVVFRDIDMETQALQELAGWAIRFTPAVSIDSPNALLLDIHSSLKFFGGLAQLQERLINDLDRWGYEVIFACAPTALAALWLARTGSEAIVLEPSELSGRLAALSLDCLHWSGAVLNILRGMGVRTLGEVTRLPRGGLAQRIGPEKLLELDRGFGRQPEPREFYRPPKMFHAAQELPLETADCRLLLESLKSLLGRLRTFLLIHQGSVQVLWLHLYHYSEPATLIRIGLLRPATDTAYLLDLIRIRFDGFPVFRPCRIDWVANRPCGRVRPGAGKGFVRRPAGLCRRGCGAYRAVAGSPGQSSRVRYSAGFGAPAGGGMESSQPSSKSQPVCRELSGG